MSPMNFPLKLLGGVGEDQNASDEMGGGTSSDANLDVMGDVGQSNVDDDLHSQPDQNFDHSNVLDEFLVMQPIPNEGEAIGGGTSGGVENVGDFGDSNVLERSVSRMTNDSFSSITLQEYSKTEISQEYSRDELESDQDISCSDSGSNWEPSELDEKLLEREMSENENISIKKNKV